MNERCSHSMLRGKCTERNCSHYDGGRDKNGATKRRRRKTGSIRTMRTPKREQERVRRSLEVLGPSQLPATRGDCENGPRPCPLVSCRFHLYIDVSEQTGTIKLNFPNREVWEMLASCALDIADVGGLTLEDVANVLNVTRERARQIEHVALRKLEESGLVEELREVGT